MTILVAISHPDDECFLGASIARFVSEGHQVFVLALADGETSRIGCGPDAVVKRMRAHDAAAAMLGVRVVESARFADQRLDVIPLLDLARVIESTIKRVKPSTVYTHSPGDLNADHRRVYDAVLPAVRPKSGVKEVYSFAGPRMIRFQPTHFVEVTKGHVDRQYEALCCYGDELVGDWAMIQARLIECGHHVGVDLAEGFEVIRCLR